MDLPGAADRIAQIVDAQMVQPGLFTGGIPAAVEAVIGLARARVDDQVRAFVKARQLVDDFQ